MKRKILIELYNVFESMKNIKNVEFMYLIIKNKFKIKDEIEIFRQLSQPSDEYIEYLKELEEIAYKYAERDENGNLVRTATGIKVKDKNISLAENAVNHLKIKHKKAINEYEERQKQIEKILDEEIDIKLEKIPYDLLPKDEISGEQLEILFPIIEK